MKEQLFQILYRESPIVIIQSKGDEMISVNPYGLQWLGYTQETFLRLSPKKLVFEADYDIFKNDNINKTVEIRFVKKNRDTVWGRLNIQKLNDSDLQIWIITAIHDLKAEIESLSQKLEKSKASNLELENFASIAAHDLKEPLRTIGNFTQLLERRYKDKFDTDGREYMDFIVNGVENMYLFINDLLIYSKVNSVEHSLGTVKLESLILLVKDTLDKEIRENKANIIVENMPISITADASKLKLLFKNLLSNAIKFHRVDVQPLIIINGEQRKSHWLFSIKDNGIGIPEEYYTKVFLLFTKLHSKHQYPGNGIGLTISQKIVEQHQGKIWFESNFENGVTFYFTIAKA